MNRSYEGPALDGRVQTISEAPFWRDGETVDATDPEPVGEERTVNVPTPEPAPDDDVERPDVDGQSTWGDWGVDR